MDRKRSKKLCADMLAFGVPLKIVQLVAAVCLTGLVFGDWTPIGGVEYFAGSIT